MPRYTPMKAAEILAGHVCSAARNSNSEPSLDMAEAIVSEYRGGHNGLWLENVAKCANPKTVYRIAKKEWVANGNA